MGQNREVEFEKTFIDGVFVVNLSPENDVVYDKNLFYHNGLNMEFIQENESMSKKGVLRGLHYQYKNSQGKLVRVIDGSIYDVVVDMRKDSKTYLQWFGIELSSQNRKQLYIPEMCAHGFLVLSDTALVNFKVSNEWSPENEIGILWNDELLNIDWPIDNENLIIAEKDKKYIKLKDRLGF